MKLCAICGISSIYTSIPFIDDKCNDCHESSTKFKQHLENVGKYGKNKNKIMIIYFMQKWSDGSPTHFKERIINGIIQNGGLVTSALSYDKMTEISSQAPKIHTMRKSFRIKQGMMLDLAYWSGRPYHSSPDRFITQVSCKATQIVKIEYLLAGIPPDVYIDDRKLNIDEVKELAINDGFDGRIKFYEHFNKSETYCLIHWTDKKY